MGRNSPECADDDAAGLGRRGRVEEDAAEDGVVGGSSDEAEGDAAFNGILEINAVAEICEILGVKNLSAGGIEHFDRLLATAAIPIQAVEGDAMFVRVGESEIHVETGAGIPASSEAGLDGVSLESAGVGGGILPEPVGFAAGGDVRVGGE